MLQSNQRPHKKLRLTIRRHTSTAGPSFQTLSKLLGKAANSNETLKLLTQISDTINTSTAEDVQDFIRKIGDHFKREQESAVRVKVYGLKLLLFRIPIQNGGATIHSEYLNVLI